MASTLKQRAERIQEVLPAILEGLNMITGEATTRLDVSVIQMNALTALRERGALTMGELGRVLSVSMSAVTGIVDKLSDRRLVARDRNDDDRRVVRVRLTKKGEKLSQEINDVTKQQIEAMLSVFTESDQLTLVGMIETLAKGLGFKTLQQQAEAK